jgi:hypothetical protein
MLSQREIAERLERLKLKLEEVLTRMLASYVEKAQQVRQVQKIDVAYADGEVHIYTYLSGRSVEARDRLYDVELECLQEFKDLPLSFHILSDPSHGPAEAQTVFSRNSK